MHLSIACRKYVTLSAGVCSAATLLHCTVAHLCERVPEVRPGVHIRPHGKCDQTRFLPLALQQGAIAVSGPVPENVALGRGEWSGVEWGELRWSGEME